MKVTRLLFAVMLSAALLSQIACSNEKQNEQDKTKQTDREKTETARTDSPDNAATTDQNVEPIDASHTATANELIDQGVKYLISQREEDGGWSMGGGMYKPAITAMVLKALMQHPDYDVSSPIVKEGFEVMLSYQQPDGGIYVAGRGQQTYLTAVAVMTLAAANDEQYKPAMEKAVAYLRKLQITPGAETEDGAVGEDSPFIGGVGYGEKGRPDLSNTGMWMQAMHDASVSGDDPAMQKAVLFVNRCQNRSESNPEAWAAKGPNDGGYVYTATEDNPRGGRMPAAAKAMGEKRSYGAMTYVGIKSLLYANVDRKDPRVIDAINWIKKYWRLDCNLNMPKDMEKGGLYYSYYVLTKALRAYGDPIIVDMKGVRHNWRNELAETLKTSMKEGGYWQNDNRMHGENVPVLTTCYSVLALEEALKKP